MLLLLRVFLAVVVGVVEGAPSNLQGQPSTWPPTVQPTFEAEWDGHDGGVIIKSHKDEREYRAITLSNKIKAVIVSDSRTIKTTVSVQVAMGYNGEKVDGLAHFVEHMLFEGSEEFPEATAYPKYLSEKGGSYNGMTWTTGTSYFFTVRNEFWILPARMLASFVGFPSMIPERFDSAIAAVDSEYKRSFNSNIRALLAVAMGHSDPESGYKSFNTGSSSSLNTSDIHELSLAFHKRYYSGNLMTMVVVSNTSLDSLEGTVREIFSDIPNSDQPRYVDSTFPFSGPSYLNKRVWMKSKDEFSTLYMGFAVNLPRNDIKLGYLYYIMDTTGKKGSVYLYLHSRGYVTNLYTTQYADGHIFVVYARLTDKGLENTDFIVKTVMTYFKSALKDGVSEELWNQALNTEEIRFQFGSPPDASWLPSIIQSNMEKGKPTEAYLGAPSTDIFDADMENAVLDCITLDNLNIYLVSHKLTEAGSEYGPALTEYEPWYNTSYAFADISPELMEELRNVEEDPELYLPELNTFVPEDFSMRPMPENPPKNPVSLANNDNMVVWWKQEIQWPEPRVNILCRFIPETRPITAAGSMKTTLLTLMLDAQKKKDENAANAELADYRFGLWINRDEWQIYASGFSDTNAMKQVVSNTFEIMDSVDFEQDEAHFNATVRDRIRNALDNTDDSIATVGSKMMNQLLYDSYLTEEEKLAALEKITQDQIEEYRDEFLRSLTVECVVHGNVEQAEALDYAQQIRRELGADEVVKDDGRREALLEQPLALPRGEWLLRGRSPNPRELNAGTKVMYFLGEGEAGFGGEDSKYMVSALASILSTLMSQSCFNYLRTVKKLGYSAGCYTSSEGSQMVFQFAVIGARLDAGPPVMRQEITNHINNEYAKFLQMVNTAEGLAAVEEAKETGIRELTDEPTSNRDSMWGTFSSIFYERTVDFERKQQKVEAIEKVTPQLLLEFYEKSFLAEDKLKLSVEAYGVNHEMPDETEGTDFVIRDPRQFREYLLGA